MEVRLGYVVIGCGEYLRCNGDTFPDVYIRRNIIICFDLLLQRVYSPFFLFFFDLEENR